jgi:hypothetical protein
MYAEMWSLTTPVRSMRVTGLRETSSDEVILQAEYELADGRRRDGEHTYRRSAGTWRQVVPAGLVQKLGNLTPQLASR